MSDEPNLAGLIADRKGTRSYDRLSDDCGGTPSSGRLHQMATKPLKNFPDPESIRGMARGLGVTVTDIVMASARSLELPVYTGNDPDALSIGGAGALDDSAKEALATVAREFIRLTSQRQDGAHDGTGTEEEQEPRTEARGPVDSSTTGAGRSRTGASIERAKAHRIGRAITTFGNDEIDPSVGSGEFLNKFADAPPSVIPEDAGQQMPRPDELLPEEILAARETDDPSGMHPDDPIEEA